VRRRSVPTHPLPEQRVGWSWRERECLRLQRIPLSGAVAVTEELLRQANLALGLSQTRYKFDVSSRLKDRFYAGASALVLVILLMSFFLKR